jgi:hypothetical protein
MFPRSPIISPILIPVSEARRLAAKSISLSPHIGKAFLGNSFFTSSAVNISTVRLSFFNFRKFSQGLETINNLTFHHHNIYYAQSVICIIVFVMLNFSVSQFPAPESGGVSECFVNHFMFAACGFGFERRGFVVKVILRSLVSGTVRYT